MTDIKNNTMYKLIDGKKVVECCVSFRLTKKIPIEIFNGGMFKYDNMTFHDIYRDTVRIFISDSFDEHISNWTIDKIIDDRIIDMVDTFNKENEEVCRFYYRNNKVKRRDKMKKNRFKDVLFQIDDNGFKNEVRAKRFRHGKGQDRNKYKSIISQ